MKWTLFFLLVPLAQADMGFYPLGQFPADTPAPIVQAAASVFKVWVPGGDVKLQLLHWTKEELEAEIADYEAKKDYPTSSQLSHCLEQEIRPCVVMNDVISGAAAVVGAGNHLFTNRHLFLEYGSAWTKALREMDPSISREEANVRFKKLPVPILIFDKNNDILARGHKSFLYLHFDQFDDHLDGPSFLGVLTSDIAVIELPQAIGTPIPLAKQKPAVGERLFVLGFPELTFDRKTAFGTSDSVGSMKLHLSFGSRISLNDSLARLSKMNGTIKNLVARLDANPTEKALWEKEVNFVLADSEDGNSGGPVLNAAGEMVSINSMRLKEYRGTDPSLTVLFSTDLTNFSL